MKQNQLIIIVVVAIIVGVVGFFAGTQYSRIQRGNARFAGQFGMMQGGPGGMRFGGPNGSNRPVVGQVSSIDTNAITIKMPDGSSKIIILSKNTAINKQATGTKNDLKEGMNIMVIGSNNVDGSVTATNIQLNPVIRGMMRNATPSGAAQ